MDKRIEAARRALLIFRDPKDRLALTRSFHFALDELLQAQDPPDSAPPLDFIFPPDELLTPDAGNSSHADETEEGGQAGDSSPPPPAPRKGEESRNKGRGGATGRDPSEPEGGSGGNLPRRPAKGRSGFNPVRYETAVRLGHDDLGNAMRFLRRHGEAVLHCQDLGGWYTWCTVMEGGGYWRLDEIRAKWWMSQVLYDIEQELRQWEPGSAEHDATLFWTNHCRHNRPWNEALEAAKIQPLVARRPEDLDANPWLFNCANGTLDLRPFHSRDGAMFRPARPADCLTKTSPVAWNPEAQCPIWLAFLERIFEGDAAMIEFIQRLCGYLLVAGNEEQKLVILQGGGANGKSVFVETIGYVAGDYATTTSVETLMESDRGGNNQYYALAKLAGVRLLQASESKEGKRLDEGLVKSMTGDRWLQARHPHGGFFNFPIEFMPWLMTNHRPDIRGTDDGIWRRILLVPFNVRIPDAEQDKQLGEKLKLEASGILKWMVDGLEEYQVILDEKGGSGLAPPAPVLEATAGYRDEQDLLGPFLADCCDLIPPPCPPEYYTVTKELKARYKAWCEEEGCYPLGPKPFAAQLRLRGCEPDNTGRQRLWRGIVLKPWDQSDTRPRSGRLDYDSGGGS